MTIEDRIPSNEEKDLAAEHFMESTLQLAAAIEDLEGQLANALCTKAILHRALADALMQLPSKSVVIDITDIEIVGKPSNRVKIAMEDDGDGMLALALSPVL